MEEIFLCCISARQHAASQYVFLCIIHNESVCHCLENERKLGFSNRFILRRLAYWNTCNTAVNVLIYMSYDTETMVGLFCQTVQQSLEVHLFFLSDSGVYFLLEKDDYFPESRSLSRILGRYGTTLNTIRTLVPLITIRAKLASRALIMFHFYQNPKLMPNLISSLYSSRNIAKIQYRHSNLSHTIFFTIRFAE